MASSSLAQQLEESRGGRDAAHVADQRLDDHGRDPRAVLLEGMRQGRRIVERQRNRSGGELGRYARGIRDAEGGESRAALHQQRIDVAVVAALELDGEVAAGEPARHPQGAHGGLGAGGNQAQALDGGYGAADLLGKLDLALGRSAEAGADLKRLAQRLDYRRMAVAEQQRSPGSHVVEERVAIDVIKAGALAARDEERIAADRAEGAHRRVDPAGHELLGALKERSGLGAEHSNPSGNQPSAAASNWPPPPTP